MTIKQVSVRSVCSFPERGNSCMVTTGTSHFRNSCKNLPPKLGRLLSSTATQVLSLVCLGLLRVRISRVVVIPSRQNTSVDVRSASCSLCHSLESTGKVLSMGGDPDHNLVLGGRAAGQGEGDGNSRRGIVDSTARGARQET